MKVGVARALYGQAQARAVTTLLLGALMFFAPSLAVHALATDSHFVLRLAASQGPISGKCKGTHASLMASELAGPCRAEDPAEVSRPKGAPRP